MSHSSNKHLRTDYTMYYNLMKICGIEYAAYHCLLTTVINIHKLTQLSP